MIRIFPVFVPARILALLISDILLVIGSFIAASYFALPVDATDYLLGEDHGLVSIALALLSILIGLYLQDLYSDIYVKSRIVLLQQLCLAVGIAFLLQGTFAYLTRLRMPLRVMGYSSCLSMGSIFTWRVIMKVWISNGEGQ